MKQHHFTVLTPEGYYISLLAYTPEQAVRKAEAGKGKLIKIVETRIRKSRVQRGYMTYGQIMELNTYKGIKITVL